MKGRASKIIHKQNGQMTILISMVFLSLFLMFGFVMNVGMLISEKVNLQNTADLAAYAGAAVQADILNKIGYINFRMRQNWKEFAYHSWITHGRNAHTHPAHYLKPSVGANISSTGSGNEYREEFACICLPGAGYKGLTGSNYCMHGCSMRWPGLEIPTILEWTPVTRAHLRAHERAREEIENEWNTYAQDAETYTPQFLDKYYQRSLRLRQIAEEYIDYLNALGRIQDPMTGQDVLSSIVRETISRNLSPGNNRPAPNDMRALNLIPRNDRPWFSPVPIETTGMVVYAKMSWDGITRVMSPSDPITETFGLGISKDITTITYYAIRLSSRPNLIYLPEHWEPVLVAYAAAKPFGSRVAPQVHNHRTSDQTILGANQTGRLRSPNFSFYDGDESGIKNIGQMQIFGNYLTGHAEQTAWATASNPNWRALFAAIAPNQYDAIRYPIFLDPTKAPIQDPMAAIARAQYPDGLEFLSGQPLHSPDRSAARDTMFRNDDGHGYDMAHDYITLLAQNDAASGDKTFRATPIQTRTSWAPGADQDIGRTGYSVKLLNIRQLLSITFQDSDKMIENLPTGDDNIENLAEKPIWH